MSDDKRDRVATALAKALAPVIREHVDNVTRPLLARLAELEAHPLRYCGVFSETEQRDDRAETGYGKGAAVTHDGSLWIALRPTSARPGTPNSGWQLAVKRPRDRRDGK